MNKNWKDNTHITSKGHSIYYGTLNDQCEKYIVFINGRCEYLDKYKYLADDLKLADTTGMLIWDHRGQGKSSGNIFHIEDYQEYLEDTLEIITKVVKEKPFVIISHSMGALIAIYALMNSFLKPEKLFISSPFLGIHTKGLSQKKAKIISYLLCKIGLGRLRMSNVDPKKKFEDNFLTSSLEKFKQLDRSKKTYNPTFSWIYSSLDAIDFVHKKENLKKINCPIEIFLSKKDKIIDPQKAWEWSEKAIRFSESSQISISFFDSKHEIFYEEPVIYNRALNLTKLWLHKNNY
jgi:lysophospholipase